jgi:hypothetical protein
MVTVSATPDYLVATEQSMLGFAEAVTNSFRLCQQALFDVSYWRSTLEKLGNRGVLLELAQNQARTFPTPNIPRMNDLIFSTTVYVVSSKDMSQALHHAACIIQVVLSCFARCNRLPIVALQIGFIHFLIAEANLFGILGQSAEQPLHEALLCFDSVLAIQGSPLHNLAMVGKLVTLRSFLRFHVRQPIGQFSNATVSELITSCNQIMSRIDNFPDCEW